MKKDFKTIVNGIIGGIVGTLMVFTVSVAAETLIGSEGVSYSNSKTNETTVSGALDELFSAVDINEEITQLKEEISLLKNDSVLDETYPVGSIYISVSATNPGTTLGGTWESFGSGRTLVGVNANNTNFNTVGKTGGSSTATLSTSNLPSHTHSIPALSGTAASTGSGYSITYGSSSRTSSSAGAHTHTVTAKGSVSSTFTGSSATTSSNGAHTHNYMYLLGAAHYANTTDPSQYGMVIASERLTATDSAGAHTHTVTAKGSVSSTFTGSSATTSSNGAHTHTVADYYATSISGVESHKHSVTTVANTTGATGSGSPFSVQDPYITVYMWKRTA